MVAVGGMQAWGMDALLAVASAQDPGTRLAALQGPAIRPAEIPGLCTERATLLLHLLPDGLLSQVTARVCPIPVIDCPAQRSHVSPALAPSRLSIAKPGCTMPTSSHGPGFASLT